MISSIYIISLSLVLSSFSSSEYFHMKCMILGWWQRISISVVKSSRCEDKSHSVASNRHAKYNAQGLFNGAYRNICREHAVHRKYIFLDEG